MKTFNWKPTLGALVACLVILAVHWWDERDARLTVNSQWIHFMWFDREGFYQSAAIVYSHGSYWDHEKEKWQPLWHRPRLSRVNTAAFFKAHPEIERIEP